MRKNKKGNIQEIAIAMIILFVAAIMFVTVKYTYGEFVDKATAISAFNTSAAAVTALEETYELTNRLDYVLFVLLIGFSLAIIVGGWFSGGHPMMSFIYFVALVLMVAVSAVFSFVWVKISENIILATTVDSFPIINLILTNFPTYIAILGFVGMLVMFARPSFTQ